MTRVPLVWCAAAGAALAVALVWPVAQPRRGAEGVGRAAWVGVLVGVLRPGPPAPIVEFLSALAAELSAGQPTGAALDAAATGLVPNPCPEALAASRCGGNVPEALRRDAHAPGAQALRGLAACWEVAECSGAGLSGAVARLAEGLRSAAAADAQLSGEVAAVRTSARLLAGLPFLGLGIGQWIGAAPAAWLMGSWLGRVVLASGLILQLLGVAWLHRMVASTRAGL